MTSSKAQSNSSMHDTKQNADNLDTTIDITIQAFYERADSVIDLANSQLAPNAHAGQVTASLTYAAARFAVSAASIGFFKAEDFAKEKEDIIAFYVKQYTQMLSDNLDDYAQNFDKYTKG